MTTPDDAPDLTLDEYTPGAAVALTDAERWPTLDAAGRDALDAVRGDPAAPVWVHVTGSRSTSHAETVIAPPAADGTIRTIPAGSASSSRSETRAEGSSTRMYSPNV